MLRTEEARERRVALTLAGMRGPVDLTYRLYKSNMHAREIQEITDWESGEISLGNDRTNGWALSVDMKRTDQLDLRRDYVLCMVELALADDDVERYPLGLYRTAPDETEPGITYLEELEMWALRMESQESELASIPPENVYSVPAGTGVLAAVRRILNDQGWPDTTINFPPPSEDSPLANRMVFDPFEDSGEDNWHSICSAILGSRSFYALKTDHWGRWFTEKIRLSTSYPSDIEYDSSSVNGEPLIVGEIEEGRDTTRFANVVTASSQDTDQTPRVYATVYNRDPDSPASIQNYGRRAYKRVERQSIAAKANAREIALTELARSAGFQRSPRIATLADPRRFRIRQTYRITDYSAHREILSEVPRWDVTSVAMSLGEGTMTHELSAVYSLEASDA